MPKLEAELGILKINNLSVVEIASQASSLYERWQTMPVDEKREVIEIITEKIVIGKDEITINLCYVASSKDMTKGWRKGWDSNRCREFCRNPLLRYYHPATRSEQPHN